MARQTVLLVYGGESANREVSIRSARSVYAAMDGEKYDATLCYVDTHGKWWLLEHWTDQLDEHGGAQLVAALGSHSFLVLPGNALIRPDVVMPLFADVSENDDVVGLARMLHLATASPSPETSMLTRQLEGAVPKLSREGVAVDVTDHAPDDRLVVALNGTAKDPVVSVVASMIDSDTPDDTLRSVSDEALAARVIELARAAYGALHCRHYAIVMIHRRGEEYMLASVDMHPELSTTGLFLKLWRMSGVHYPEVIDALIATAHK